VDVAALRSQFPVLERVAYLNAGTDGPIPSAAVEAAREELESELVHGRTTAHFERRFELQGELRDGYARVLGCDAADVALTTSTSEGLGAVLAGMDLRRGHEIVTAEREHPGLLGPLAAARARGVTVREVPFARLAEAVTPHTTLVACSHVNWHTGELAPAELAQVGVPVVLDGAQGAGAVPLDMAALRCDAYAASGQKWLCGADGTGMLFVSPAFRERVISIAPSYVCFESVTEGLDSPLRGDARRYDTPSLARESAAFSLAALKVLEGAGLDAVHARGREQAARLAALLAERGRAVAPRGDSTLVAWEDSNPEATRDRAAAAGVVIRNLPGTSLLRASVGAWNDDGDLERLLEAL
jgi:L-cysteine/cystine lyase